MSEQRDDADAGDERREPAQRHELRDAGLLARARTAAATAAISRAAATMTMIAAARRRRIMARRA